MGEGWGEHSFSPPLRGGEVKGWVRSDDQKPGGQEGRLVSFIGELVKLSKDLLMIIA